MSEQERIERHVGYLVIKLRWLQRFSWLVPKRWISQCEAELHALSYLYYSLYGAPDMAERLNRIEAVLFDEKPKRGKLDNDELEEIDPPRLVHLNKADDERSIKEANSGNLAYLQDIAPSLLVNLHKAHIVQRNETIARHTRENAVHERIRK